MREFKIGDKVKIPSEPDKYWSYWTEEMNENLGSVSEITKIHGGFIYMEDEYVYRPSYLRSDPYNQSEQPMQEIHLGFNMNEEIDDRNKFSEEQIEILKELRFDTLEVSFVEGRIMGALAGTNFETPKPKTRPLTNFEILKMDAVFKINKANGDLILTSEWISERDIENWEYCLKSDFQKAQSLEDVVWKQLTTEEP